MNEHNIINRAKQHVKDNKKVYIAGGVCFVAGALGCKLLSKSGALVNVKPIQALTYKSTQITEVYIEALGDPGNIVQDLTTGTVYASQNQAAHALGVNSARITEHLAGKIPNVNGHTLQKIGKATVPTE